MPRKYTSTHKVFAHLIKARACRKIRVPKKDKYISRTLRVPTAVYDKLRAEKHSNETMWQTLCRTRIGLNKKDKK